MPSKKRQSRPVISAPTLTEAVKALRLALGDTQQEFATRLGIAISSAVRYESTRPPHGKMLGQLYRLALKNQHFAVASMFHQALIVELGAAASYKLGDAELEVLLALQHLRNETESREKIIRRLEKALAVIEAMNPFSGTAADQEESE
jgi:transcriptional regulator with XRE-family HTH domain